jgi:hypothetical protein
MERRFLAMVAVGLVLCLMGTPAWGDDFYVIAGGGPSGKVLKTQLFINDTPNTTLGSGDWEKLSSPQWIYTKVSATSYLVITYQDSLGCTGGFSLYQLRVNDQVNVAGANAAILLCNNTWGMYGATGVWSGLPKGEVTLSIWHCQSGCTACEENAGSWTTNIVVTEIEH